ncbi:MAG: hypothetical protein COZ43_02545 [Sphingomonadales bacterium CG_4_10_14_3_um_filter_58_15]|nr:MAG: hypothetical protein COZ43_02545 [Sphingomonadales bacterium CG_4_10_14_3_um_filter_58_15]
MIEPVRASCQDIRRSAAFSIRNSASIAALATAILFLPSPASAQQATPGSSKCPIDADGVVTCSGDVRAGFRASLDPAMRELRFRNLTQPIAPETLFAAIDVRPVGDLTLDLDASVIINSRLPRSSFTYGAAGRPDAAITLLFDEAVLTTAEVTSAAAVTVDGFGDSRDFNMGAFLIADADIVNFTNSGSILSRNETASLNRRLTSGVRIIGADQIAFRNDGTISNIGIQSTGVFLEGRSVQFINTGNITATAFESGRNVTFPALGIAIATPSAAANLEVRNTGTLQSTDAPRAAESIFGFYGRGTIDVDNSGTLASSGLQISAVAQNRTDDLVVTLNNSGPVSNTEIGVTTPTSFDLAFEGRTAIWPVDMPPIGVRYRNADISFVNSGRITTATLFVAANADNVRIDLTNRGAFDGRLPGALFGRGRANDPTNLITASGVAPLTGNALVRIVNEGTITPEGNGEVGHSILNGFSSHGIEVINSGRIAINFPSDTKDFFVFEVTQGATTRTVGAEASYVFDGLVNVANSGSLAIDVITGFQESSLIAISAISRIDLTNSAPITLTNRFIEGTYTTTGVRLYGLSGATFDNSATISVTAPTGNDGIGIAFLETSLSEADGARLISEGRLRGYSRADDIASVVTLNLNGGDIMVDGPGSYGIFGIIGDVTDDPDHLLSSRTTNNSATAIGNGSASARINIANGVSVIGGTGPSAAIVLEGAGRMILNNAGSIISRDDATGGAVVLGNISTLRTTYGRMATPDGFTLSLTDSVNSGTIRADNGRGIWVRSGGVANFINRGLILGGIAAIDVRDVGQIDNQAGGIIDGAILLAGAGSTLRNSGLVRMTSAAGTTSTINGDYTQLAGGALTLRGTDRFNTTGNFILAGNLNLALGAPSTAAIIDVGGDLSLDARLNVTDAGGFGSGVYRLFDYGGTLSGNGLTLGALPNGASGSIQTAIAQQINLVVGTNQVQFWDGADSAADGTIDGGTGTWNNSSTNWTRSDALTNEAWGGKFAVFQGMPGTVTIATDGITATGLQFAVDGYRLEGGDLALSAPGLIRVGDGTAASSAMTATIASSITGTGGVEKTDFGTLILAGVNSYSGGTRVTGGTLRIGADTALGGAAGGVTLDGGTLGLTEGLASARAFTIGMNGGTIDFGGDNVMLSGLLGGSGNLSLAGSGVLSYSGNGSGYGGLVTVGGGTLSLNGSLGGRVRVDTGARLGGNGTLGSLNVGGTLAPGGSGSASNDAPATANLAVANLASAQGTIGSNAPQPQPAVADPLPLPPQLTGAALARALAAGGMIIGGENASYTAGASMITGGENVAFDLDMIIGGENLAFADALIQGGINTPLASDMITGGENITFASGQNIGTLTINGDLSLDAGSFFEVEVDDQGNSDRVVVLGSVSLGNATLRVLDLLGGDFLGSNPFNYLIIDNDAMDAVNGIFGSVTNELAFLTPTVTYTAGDGNDVQLTLTPNGAPPPPPPPPPPPTPTPVPTPVPTPTPTPTPTGPLFPTVAKTFNQTSAATALDGFGQSAGSDSLLVYRNVLFTTVAQALRAFDTSSGEIYPTLLADSLDAGMARAGRLTARSHEAFGDGWGIWGGLTGRTGTVDGDGNAASTSHDSYGFDMGMDYRGPDNSWAIGASVGYSNSDLEIAERQSRASGDAWHVGAYGRYGTGGQGITATAAVSYSNSEHDVTRGISVNGLARTATGSVDIDTIALEGELRYGFGTVKGWSMGPTVSIQHASSDLGRFAETGADALNLSGNGATDKRTRLGGGIFANWQGTKGGLDASAQYVGGNSNLAQVQLTMAGAPGITVPIRSARTDGSGGLFTVAGEYDLGGGWTIGGNIRSFITKDEKSAYGSVTVGWRF